MATSSSVDMNTTYIISSASSTTPWDLEIKISLGVASAIELGGIVANAIVIAIVNYNGRKAATPIFGQDFRFIIYLNSAACNLTISFGVGTLKLHQALLSAVVWGSQLMFYVHPFSEILIHLFRLCCVTKKNKLAKLFSKKRVFLYMCPGLVLGFGHSTTYFFFNEYGLLSDTLIRLFHLLGAFTLVVLLFSEIGIFLKSAKEAKRLTRLSRNLEAASPYMAMLSQTKVYAASSILSTAISVPVQLIRVYTPRSRLYVAFYIISTVFSVSVDPATLTLTSPGLYEYVLVLLGFKKAEPQAGAAPVALLQLPQQLQVLGDDDDDENDVQL